MWYVLQPGGQRFESFSQAVNATGLLEGWKRGIVAPIWRNGIFTITGKEPFKVHWLMNDGSHSQSGEFETINQALDFIGHQIKNNYDEPWNVDIRIKGSNIWIS